MRSVLSRLRLLLAGLDRALRRRVVRQHLADDEQSVAVALHRLGDDLLGDAVAVHLGGVDQGDAEIDAEPQRLDLVGMAAAAFAHVPGALAVGGHLLAIGQRDLRHGHREPPSRRRKTNLAAPYLRSSIIANPSGAEKASPAAISTMAVARAVSQPMPDSAVSAGPARPLW